MTRSLAALVAVPLLAACSVTVPVDPDGTLDRVRGGVLRVGVSPNPPWTDLPAGSGAAPAGREVELVRAFAESIDADVQWEAGGEAPLMDDLEHGELDLVVGGLTAASPFADRAALTVEYTTSTDGRGGEEGHVMAAPMGENAFLVALERFLLEQEARP